MFPIRDATKKHPNAKAFLIQLGPLTNLSLVDPEYIKEYKQQPHYPRLRQTQKTERHGCYHEKWYPLIDRRRLEAPSETLSGVLPL